MRNSIVNGGSIVGGLLASACCIGPLVLSLLGLGGLSFAASLEPYRPYFIGLTFIFVALGFYFSYRPQDEQCSTDDTCAAPRSRRKQRLLLWIVSILALMLVAFPNLLPLLPI